MYLLIGRNSPKHKEKKQSSLKGNTEPHPYNQPSTTNKYLYLYLIILYLKKNVRIEIYYQGHIKLLAHLLATAFHSRLVSTPTLGLTVLLRFTFTFSILCVFHNYVLFTFFPSFFIHSLADIVQDSFSLTLSFYLPFVLLGCK